jgi:small subunit ribosomal protein S17
MARKITGKVTSDVQDKTIVVTVTTSKTHPIYGKTYKVSNKFQAHDENNDAHKGDTVIIAETRPISKTKSFVLETIVERGHAAVELKKEAVEEEAEKKAAEKAAKKAAETEASLSGSARQSSESLDPRDKPEDDTAKEDK